MGIRVARGLASHMSAFRDGFVIQVKGAADQTLVGRALDDARRELLHISREPSTTELAQGPKFVSEVMPSTDGPFVMVDASHTSDQVLREIPHIIQRHLERYGVVEAVLAPPSYDERLKSWPGPALTAHLFVLPDTSGRPVPLPDTWQEQALSWVERGAAGEAWILRGFPLPMEKGLIREVIPRFVSGPSEFALFVGDLWADARVFGFHPSAGMMTVGVGGSSFRNGDFSSQAGQLKQLVMALRPYVAFGCLQVRPAFDVWLRLLERRFDDTDRGAHVQLIGAIIDEFVPDVFPWQLLGPGHLARLGAIGEIARRLPDRDGYAEVDLAPITSDLGDPASIAALRTEGKDVLGPCLISEERAISERHARWRQAEISRDQNRGAN